MVRTFLHIGARVALSLALIFCAYVVARRAIGLYHYRVGGEGGMRAAIEWDPSNPQYYADLARLLERSTRSKDLNEIIALYEKATRLSPNQARYWSELAGAYELNAERGLARQAYLQAQRLFPNSPEINWQLGNFYLRQGEISSALHCFRKVIEADASLRQQAFDLAWRATDDADAILSEMIPPRMRILFQYLNYLANQRRIDEAIQVWERIASLPLAFDPEETFFYLDALIRDKRVVELQDTWRLLIERNPTLMHRQSLDDNLVTNGGFESFILNGGLDWRIRPLEGVIVSVDSLIFLDGTHSLKIEFDGDHNPDYHHIFQYIPVKPNTVYRLTGYMRAKSLTTDQGLRIEVFDAYDPLRLHGETEAVVGTMSWSPQQLEILTTSDTKLLTIRIKRRPSRKFDNQVGGTIWVDRLSLQPVE